MRGFRQTPKDIERLTDGDLEAMLQAARAKRFQSDHYRGIFTAYLEVAIATGARVGSILSARFADVDWEGGTITFPHVKNKEEHTALLTPRALVALRKWLHFIEISPFWKGRQTPIFVGPKGKVLSIQTIDRQLRAVAVHAGVRKKVSTHRLRKSVGTAIAQVDPDFAARQLGVSFKILQRHYNMPSMEDLMAKRELLPGAKGFVPRSPEEIAGWATLEHIQGRMTDDELREHLDRARKLLAHPRKEDYSPEVA
jgi:integrase